MEEPCSPADGGTGNALALHFHITATLILIKGPAEWSAIGQLKEMAIKTSMRHRGEGGGQGQRYLMLDCIRGLAVCLMIVFHLIFDLHHFRFIQVGFMAHPYWIDFARFIVFLFLLCVGMALPVVHRNGIRWDQVWKRFAKLGACAVAITIVTYILYPRNFIFFGALHCIAVSSVAGVFFVGRPRLALGLFFLLVIPDIIFQPTLMPLSKWLNVVPADYVPFYPWVGVVLLGIYLESIGFNRIPLARNLLTRPVAALGRHSLVIYLLHQPILFGTFLLIYHFKSIS